jgi:methylated-DNA-[protein]-cysteine S-methyltransferase
MTHPTKHIIIIQTSNDKNKEFHPILIDFERARFSKNPKNLTQFISYLNSKKVLSLLGKKDILVNSQNLLAQIKNYKKTIGKYNDFSQDLSNISSITNSTIELKKNIWLNPSTFSEKVLTETILIPKGKVTSYSHIAKKLNTKAFRAVGVALSKNQFAPVVPCHRVVCSNGFIGGFNGGYEDSKIKEKLLKSEGIEIFKSKDRSVVPKKYFLE